MFNQIKLSLHFIGIMAGCISMNNLSIAANTNSSYVDPSYMPPAPQAVSSSEADAFRILFVGNSITRHGVNEDTKSRLKWNHIAGMAASCEEKDFAHRLGAMIQATMKDRKVEIYFYGSPFPSPNLVVVQTGEHETPGKTVEERSEAYVKSLKPYLNLSPKPLILCVGVWHPTDKAPYGGLERDINLAYESVCRKYNIPFVSVERFATDPSCHGWGESPGVQWHPNDKGMEGYASLLFNAFQKTLINNN